MNQLQDTHPGEDDLIAYAVNGEEGVHKEHIESCPACARYVKEIRTIKTTIQSLPDKEVPEKIRKAILSSIKHRSLFGNQWFHFEISTWYKNPIVVGLGVVGIVIFLYIFFVFVL